MRAITLQGGEHAVLALHGLPGNPLEMLYIGKRLQEAEYTVVIPFVGRRHFPGAPTAQGGAPWSGSDQRARANHSCGRG